MQSIKFAGSFPNYEACPQDQVPEYAFIGRSNVGKSSLINMLTGRKELARTSKKPGKTRMINMFLINDQWRLVDLPGYGYARVSKTMKSGWKQLIERYLERRRQLVCTFVLIDIRHPLQENDLEFINWMGGRGISFVIIWTKIDKISRQKVHAQQREIERALSKYWDPLPERFLTSAVTGEGREDILRFINLQNSRLGIAEP